MATATREVAPTAAARDTVRTYDASPGDYASRYANVDMGSYLAPFLKLLPGQAQSVLDAGCGSGRDLTQFLRAGVHSFGLDISLGMLTVASKAAPGAHLVRGDLRALPFRSECFGGVWSVASFLHLAPADFEEAFESVHRVLVPGGVFFLSVAHGIGSEWRQDTVGRRWFHFYSESDVREASDAVGLEVVRMSTDPGVVQGDWVNLLARKPR